jgi:hypothetical protein
VTAPGTDDGQGPAAGIQNPGSERLDALREEVETVDGLAVGDRVAVFERVNEGIADELARLDEV